MSGFAVGLIKINSYFNIYGLTFVESISCSDNSWRIKTGPGGGWKTIAQVDVKTPSVVG